MEDGHKIEFKVDLGNELCGLKKKDEIHRLNRRRSGQQLI
jgi:hypothetical protein